MALDTSVYNQIKSFYLKILLLINTYTIMKIHKYSMANISIMIWLSRQYCNTN